MERGISLAIERFGPVFAEKYHPTARVATTLQHIRDCRTEAMGGRRLVCPECGHEEIVWNSCRDRHCPNCQQAPREAWLASRKEELVSAVYHHAVFTIPSELNPWMLGNMREAYAALFKAAWDTISTFGKQQGIQMGMTALLHTWGSTLSYHPHLHCIVPTGGADLKTRKWKRLPWHREGEQSPFLFPVRAMSVMFRAKFMAEFTSKVKIPENVRQLCFAKGWNVNTHPPVCGVDKTLEYIARYAYRVAISNHRIQEVTDTSVTFDYKDYKDEARVKQMTIDGIEFLRRYSLHILPERFVRIRHYGFLAPGNRELLAQIQQDMNLQPVERHRPRKTWQKISADKGLIMNLCRKCKKATLIETGWIPQIRSPTHNPSLFVSVSSARR